MRNKTIAFAAGLLFALLVVEAALRINGALLEDREKKPAAGTRAHRIVCFGDSFTYGEGAPAGMSYPAQLERLLNGRAGGGPFEVINKGRPAQNTAQLLDTLQGSLDAAKPEAAVLLTGGYNLSNYYGYARYAEGTTLRARLLDQLYRVRVYKLARHLRDNVREKAAAAAPKAGTARIERNAVGGEDREYAALMDEGDLLRGGRRYREAGERYERAVRRDPARPEGYAGLGFIRKELGETEAAAAFFRKALEADPLYSPAYNNLGWLLLNRGKSGEALAYFEKAVGIDPELESNYSALISVCQFSRDGGMREKVRALLLKLRDERHIANPSLQNALTLLEKDEEDSRDALERWIEHDIDGIIAALRENGVYVIMQSYPRNDALNVLLRRIAERNRVPFADNEAAFREALRTARREDVYAPDGHCNARGYGIMARTVRDVMSGQGILDR